jgi:hypothetical protein
VLCVYGQPGRMSSSAIVTQWLIDTRNLWPVNDSLGHKEQMKEFEIVVSLPTPSEGSLLIAIGFQGSQAPSC